MTLVDNAVYVDGERTADPKNLDETFEVMRERHGMCWIGLYRPGDAEIQAVAREFGLDIRVVEDAIRAHQRPKLERYGDVLFTVLWPARYLEDVELVEFGEVHIITGPDFVTTIRHSETPELAQVRRRLEGNPDLLRMGPEAVLYAILDQIVDEYAPVVAGIEDDIGEIQDQLFNGNTDVSRRIYQLSREVIAFQRATHPLIDMLEDLKCGFDQYDVDTDLQRDLRDVQDHIIRVVDRADWLRAVLQNALTVQATLVAQRQNEEMRNLTAASLEQNEVMRGLTEASLAQNEQVKRISAWAAILFAPTLVGTIYGMNFDSMPELHWQLGYPVALALMVLTSVTLYVVFKRLKWL